MPKIYDSDDVFCRGLFVHNFVRKNGRMIQSRHLPDGQIVEEPWREAGTERTFGGIYREETKAVPDIL